MIKMRVLEGVKPTLSIKKKQVNEVKKAATRVKYYEAGHGGSRAFFRGLAERYEKEGTECMAEVCRNQAKATPPSPTHISQ